VANILLSLINGLQIRSHLLPKLLSWYTHTEPITLPGPLKWSVS